MSSLWLKRVTNLLCVKSIVTIALTGVFAYLSIIGQISSQDFLTIFSVVIAFYFGTQSQNPNEKVEKELEQKKTSSSEQSQSR
nr:hypothetical protein [Anaerotruncus colihominis]